MSIVKLSDRNSLYENGTTAPAAHQTYPAASTENAVNYNIQVNSFSDCSELRRYLSFLPDESRSIKQLSGWLIKEQYIITPESDRIEDNTLLQPENQYTVQGEYRHTYNLLGQRRELLNLVIHNIARLHAAYRETLVSLYFEQHNMRETAQIMGKSISTIKRYRDAGILDLFFRLKHYELAQCQINQTN
ncbi:MAG TPA: hypothetical protein GXZ59_02395 [Clostridiaceae bacterium]|nr:hypothetical protein [Clostridiaceae bacterium]